MDTQSYEYLFAKAVAVVMYHGFMGCLHVCKQKHKHRKKSVLFSTNVGSWFSYLQPNFAKIVQMKLFFTER